MPSLHSFLLLRPLSPFILKPQEVGRGLGLATAWRKSWEEVAYDLRKDGRGDLESFATRVTWVSPPVCSSITRNVGKRWTVAQAGVSEVPDIPDAACVLWVRQSPIHLVNSETPVEQLPHAGNTQPYPTHVTKSFRPKVPLLSVHCSAPDSASCRNCPEHPPRVSLLLQ